MVAIAHRPKPRGGVLENKELCFDPQVKAIAHGRCLVQHPLEDRPVTSLKGLTHQMQIAGKPDDFRIPGQHRGASRVGDGADFVIADVLGHPIQGRSGKQF